MDRVLSPYVQAAFDYAEGVEQGRIVACKWIKLAVARFARDLTRSDMFLDELAADRVCAFVEKLHHVKGKWAGAGIKLEPWQCFGLVNVFGWFWSHTKLRRFRTSYWEVPRKNAKSTTTAGVSLYMLTADGEKGAECYTAATSRDQAGIVFNDARQMALRDRELLSHFGLNVGSQNLSVSGTASKFEPLSAHANTLDGLNVHFAAVDELHAHRKRLLWDVLETATGSRLQSLIWAISTAGTDRAGICYEQHLYLRGILEQAHTDDSFFGLIYTIDDDDRDDWSNPAVWAKANPNLNVSLYPEQLARLCNKAMQLPSFAPTFLQKHLNVWTSADAQWMDMVAWDRAGDAALQLADFAGEESFGGLDLASKVDLACYALVFVRGRDYFAFLRHYIPEECVEEAGNAQYQGWAARDWLTTTPGNVIDFDAIERAVIDDASTYRLGELAFDPYQATQLSQHLRDHGIETVEVRPSVLNFSEPMKELEALVLAGRFHHNGDPVLAWAVSNVVCHRDAKDNIYPRKERVENKIDPVIALLMALGRALKSRDITAAVERSIERPLIFGPAHGLNS